MIEMTATTKRRWRAKRGQTTLTSDDVAVILQMIGMLDPDHGFAPNQYWNDRAKGLIYRVKAADGRFFLQDPS